MISNFIFDGHLLTHLKKILVPRVIYFMNRLFKKSQVYKSKIVNREGKYITKHIFVF